MMRALLSPLFCLLLALSLGGCATRGAGNAEPLKSGATIVPLSLMGEKLAIRFVGTTDFQNESRDAAVPEWKIDALVEQVAAKAIREGGRYAAVQVDTSGARNSIPRPGTGSGTGTARFEDWARGVAELAKAAGANYVLVIAPTQLGDPFFDTHQNFSGYGIYQRAIFTTKNAVNFLTMKISLVEPGSGEQIAQAATFNNSPRPRTAWMESNNLALDEANARETRFEIEWLAERTLRHLIEVLKLTP